MASRRSARSPVVLLGALLLAGVLWLARSPLWHAPSPALPATALVARVVDGDTVELDDGRRLRYLGIDTPEVRRRRGQDWIYAPEPFAEAASEANRALVEGRRVRLEYDTRTHDKYDRLLAYVYVGDTCINAELLRRGLARVLILPPNTHHADAFAALQRQAREQRVGMWGE